MNADEFYRTVLGPGLVSFSAISPGSNTPAAARFLLAVAMQESGLTARQQIGGPANGWWQFEWGGCHGVMQHTSSRACALAACRVAAVAPDASAVYAAIVGHDNLAVAIARGLLLTDPYPIPSDVKGGWACYIRLWRPGKPRSLAWPEHWDEATATVYGTAKESA